MRESKREEKAKVKEKIDKSSDDIVIQEDELEEIKEEMADNKSKSNERNDKKYRNALKNIIIGCGIIIYFAVLLFGKGKISSIDYIKVLKTVIICDLLASLVLLEVGFRKDKFCIGLHGIEMAFVGGFTIFMLNLFSKTLESFTIWFSIMVGFVAVYYLAKAIIIVIKKEKIEPQN